MKQEDKDVQSRLSELVAAILRHLGLRSVPDYEGEAATLGPSTSPNIHTNPNINTLPWEMPQACCRCACRCHG